MTIYTPDQTSPGGFVPQTDKPLPIHIDSGYFDAIPGAGFVGNAAMRDSWLGKAVSEFAQSEPDNPYTNHEADPDFDPFQHVQGYEDSLPAFLDARNLDDVAKVKARVDDQRQAQGVLGMSGGPGVAARLAVAAFDPLNFIGGAGLAGDAAKGASLIHDLADGALLGAGIGAGDEALQGRFDPSYSSTGMATRIGASALLMGALGGGAHVLTSIMKDEGRLAVGAAVADDAFSSVADPETAAALRSAAAGIDRDLTIPHGDDPMVPEMAAAGAGGSLSSAAARETTLADETLKSAFGAEKLTGELTPMMRGLQSDSLEMRRSTQDLIQVPLRFAKNATDGASPRAVETMARLWDAPLARSLTAVDDSFLKYRLGMSKPGGISRLTGAVRAGVQDVTGRTAGKLSRAQFLEQVGKAMRRGDEHPIPEVADAAKAVRREIIDPLKQRAIEAGMLPEDIGETLKTAPSYLTRVYNRGKIIAQRGKFEDVLFSGLKRWQASAGERMNAALERVPRLEAKVKKLEDYLSVLRNPAAGEGGIEPAVGSIAAARKAAKTAKETRIAKERDAVAARTELRRATVALEQANARAEKFKPDEAPKEHPLQDVIRDLKQGIRGKAKMSEGDLADREAELKDWERFFDEKGIDAQKMSADEIIAKLENPEADFRASTPASRAKFRETEFVKRRAEVRKDKATEAAAEAETGHAEAKATRNEARTRVETLVAQRFEIEKNLSRYKMHLDTARKGVDTERGLATAEDGELRDSVRQIADKLIGGTPGRLNFEPVPLSRGPMKERTLNFVSDAEIEPFLESNIEHIARVYKHSMASDSELAARFGRADMEPQIQAVKEDYARLRKEATDKITDTAKQEKQFQKLAKQERDDLRDLTAMRDLIRGTYALPDNPSGFAARTARVMKQANFVRLMGGMTLASIPDLGRPVMVHGLERTMMNGIRPLVSNWRGFRLMAEEGKLAAVGLDMVMDNRTMQLTDIFDDYGRLSKYERGLSWMTTRMGLASLMTPWNATLKQFSSIIAQSRMLKAITEGANAQEKEWMASLGIDGETAVKIGKEYAAHGETQDGGVMWANTDKWSSRDAVEAYRAALLKSVDSTIVTPGVGDRPLWMSTTLGGVVGQFRTFSFASTQHVALAGLQQRDAAVLNGLFLSIGLGMLSYAVKTDADHRSNDPRQWILAGVDRSGVLGIVSDITQMGAKTVGLNMSGSRYAARGSLETFAGPSAGLVNDALTAAASASDLKASSAEVSAFRRLVPFQNLFYLRNLFDAAQTGIENSGYGAPQ